MLDYHGTPVLGFADFGSHTTHDWMYMQGDGDVDELRLQAAEAAMFHAQENLRAAEATLAQKTKDVEEARTALSAPKVHKRLLTAYVLWATTPLMWPGGYLFYFGRVTECLLQTITFGGFGIGWLVDALYIPAYVADCNEAVGHIDHSRQRSKSYFSLLLLLAPLRFILQLMVGAGVGIVAANLVSQRWLSSLIGAPQGVMCRLGIGTIFAAAGVRVSCSLLGGIRTSCRWRPLFGWAVLVAAIFLGSAESMEKMLDEGLLAYVFIVTGGACFGSIWGKDFAVEHAPRRTLAKRTSRRFLRQVLLVGFAATAATGAFYLNGSITLTDHDTGKPTTYRRG